MTPVLIAITLLAQSAASPPPAPAAPPDLAALVTLRTADEACALFDPARRALLEASIAQSRDDQVRAGIDPRRLDTAEQRLAAATRPNCADPVIAGLAADHTARVQQLAGYSDLTFPGIHRRWLVDRGATRSVHASQARWRVSQRDMDATAWFGVYEREGAMHLALAYNGDTPAARAALIFRDPARQAYPIDFSAGGLLAPPDNDPAASWGAGLRGQMRVLAAGRLDADSAARLAPAGGAPARGFTFPQSALAPIAHLTPRESVGVELFDATGRVAERIWFEVGALRAALAMQAVPLVAPDVDAGPAQSAPAP